MVLAQKRTHKWMQYNRGPRMNLHLYGQLIYDKGGNTISSKTDAGETRQLYAKEPSWTTLLLHTQKQTKWVKS